MPDKDSPLGSSETKPTAHAISLSHCSDPHSRSHQSNPPSSTSRIAVQFTKVERDNDSPAPAHTMEFPLIRRERSPVDASNFINGMLGDTRPHVPERNLPGGGNWVVQKFGGTSVGKFPVKIAEEVVQ